MSRLLVGVLPHWVFGRYYGHTGGTYYGQGYRDGSGAGTGAPGSYDNGAGSIGNSESIAGNVDGAGEGLAAVDVVVAADPIDESFVVTEKMLEQVGACYEGRRQFMRAFPDGARFPEDLGNAFEQGLDLDWAQEYLGLMRPGEYADDDE